jgi:chaperonin GroES
MPKTATATKLNLKPLADRVLVREIEEDQAEVGGILLPEDAEADQDLIKAEVVAVGTDTDEIEVKAGETVLVDSLAGKTITRDDATYRIVKAEDVAAVVT